MSYYNQHIFLCTNQKVDGKTCCANSGGEQFFEYFKDQLKELGLHGPGKVRISKSGCLGRCRVGPCIVIYPDNIWYRYSSLNDIDRIIQSHLVNGKLVDDLMLPSEFV